MCLLTFNADLNGSVFPRMNNIAQNRVAKKKSKQIYDIASLYEAVIYLLDF